MNVVINSACIATLEETNPLLSQGSALLNFLMCLGYDPSDPPLADLLRRSRNLKGEWFILSPIHWQATHNDAMIVAAGRELHMDESVLKSWFQAYADYLKEENEFIEYYDQENWLLRSNNQPPLSAKPVYQIMNRSLMPELSKLDSTLYWQRFFTEGQMFFASRPNQSLLNGFWAWGGSHLSGKRSISVCADEQWMKFAQICSSEIIPYDPSVDLDHVQILLLDHIDILSIAHKEQLSKRLVHWYWNNLAYICCEQNWYTRLWRRLKHAH